MRNFSSFDPMMCCARMERKLSLFPLSHVPSLSMVVVSRVPGLACPACLQCPVNRYNAGLVLSLTAALREGDQHVRVTCQLPCSP